MLTIFARFLSLVLNPVFVIVPVPFLLVYHTTSDIFYSLKWSILSYLFIGVAGLFMLFAVWRGVFSDLDVSRRNQRPLLFLVVFLITMLYLVVIYFLHGPSILLIAVIGILGSIIFISLVNRKIKASLHMATITAVLMTLGILYGLNILAFALIPVIGWARVRAKRHSVQETIIGCICGAFVTVLMYVSMRYLLLA